jgi:hypothetical protein
MPWAERAACRDSDLTFVHDPKNETYSPVTIVRCLEVCAVCPVRRECLLSALTADVEMVGCWGGTSTLERRRALPHPPGGPLASESDRKARTRRAQHLVDEFEATFAKRLEKFRGRAAHMQAWRARPCVDCGGDVLPTGNFRTCKACGVREHMDGRISRPGEEPDEETAT